MKIAQGSPQLPRRIIDIHVEFDPFVIQNQGGKKRFQQIQNQARKNIFQQIQGSHKMTNSTA